MTPRRFLLSALFALAASVIAVIAALPAQAGTQARPAAPATPAAKAIAAAAAVRSEAESVLPKLTADGAGFVRDGAAPKLPTPAIRLGTLASREPFEVDLALLPRNPTALARFATDVSTPGTSDYRHFITVKRFAAEYGATPAAVTAVRQAMAVAGLHADAVTANSLELKVTGTVGAFERAFATQLDSYRLSGGRVAFANTSAPRLAASAAKYVTAVIGLNDFAKLEPQVASTSAVRPTSASGVGAATTATTTTASTTTATSTTQTDTVTTGATPVMPGPAPTTTTPATATSYANGPTPCAAAVKASGEEAVGILPLGLLPVSAPIPNPSIPTPVTQSEATTYNYDSLSKVYDYNPLYEKGYLGSNPKTGASVPVGIFELESNFTTDPQGFDNCYGIGTKVGYVQVDGTNGSPSAANSDGFETALDIETISALAPNADITVFQGNGDAPTGWLDTFDTIVERDTDKVVSVSYGACEELESTLVGSSPQAELPLFEEAATQGQTFVVSSGDAGAEGCRLDTDTQLAAVDDPAADPFVTGVGGTFIASVGDPEAATPTAPTETTWNGGVVQDSDDTDGAGGGGLSTEWLMPSYQLNAPASLGVINAESEGLTGLAGTICSGSLGTQVLDAPDSASYYCREVPDVSADASPYSGYNVYYDGAYAGVGGTSGAAPVWAALFALADSVPGCQIGFANPVLYAIAGSSRYAHDFNDVTVGDNDLGVSNGGYFKALTGYDMATGLGTPNAANLVPDLCADETYTASTAAKTTTVTKTVTVASKTKAKATCTAGKLLSFVQHPAAPALETKAIIYINGKKMKTVRSRQIYVVRLKRPRASTFTLRIVSTLNDGEVISHQITYHGCKQTHVIYKTLHKVDRRIH
jgi:subtilase family serine protease